MRKEEYAIGEVFQYGLKKLKVVKVDDDCGCIGCSVYSGMGSAWCSQFVGNCLARKRKDGESVIFKVVEEENEKEER